MNSQEIIKDLNNIIKEKDIIINSLIENSESQSMTNKVLLDRLIEQDIELNNIKSGKLN